MAGSKPTAVHFTLIFFVMLSLFLGVFAYMFFTDYQEANAKLAQALTDVDSGKQALANEIQKIEEIKSVLGHEFAVVGSADDPNSVLGALSQDMKTVVGMLAAAPQKQTVREVWLAVAAQLKNRAEVAQQAQQSENDSKTNFQAQTDQQNNSVVQAQQSQKDAEAQLRMVEAQMAEQVTDLAAQVNMWKDDYRDMLGKYDTLDDQFKQAQEDWLKEKSVLQNNIDFQKEQIAQLQNTSFESSDGEIIHVDNTTRSVWINRGERDYLRPQVTFSVYTKEHSGIARSTADVKAKIEVVEVQARTARCKILDEDLVRPIAPGDPIFTPLWHAGLVEKMAFMGIIDLTGDGESDRELLQEIMDVNHAQLKLQILDDGTRVPAEAKLDVDTKYLVEGEFPDPNDFPGADEKQRHIESMMQERNKLLDEAKIAGVQIISLNDFRTYIGYKNQQRVFRPGDNKPFNLGAGAASQGVGETLGDRTSGGNTSELFNPNRTNQRFGGSR